MAYFDKSVWRPSLLDSSQTIELPGDEAAAAAAAAAAPLQPHLREQQNRTFGRQLVEQSSRSSESLAAAADRLATQSSSPQPEDDDADDDDEAADRIACKLLPEQAARLPEGSAAFGARRPLVRQQSTFVAGNADNSQDTRRASDGGQLAPFAAHRLGELLEWLLVGGAPTDEPAAAEGQPIRRPARDVALKAVRFCLLVLLMNLVLRLADRLVAALIESLAFCGGGAGGRYAELSGGGGAEICA